MSTYERYDETSADYDTTRAAVGAELVADAITEYSVNPTNIALLDVGCGSGNFSAALIERVGHIDAIDMSTGMLGKAREKLSAASADGRIAFHQGDIRSLPFPDSAFDAAMVNQVLHHLESGTEDGYPGHREALAEIHRVLRPGGILTLHFCDHHQLQNAFWFYQLIPKASAAALRRCAALAHLEQYCAEIGFTIVDRLISKDQVLMGSAYFDGRGPLDAAWRNGDSIWAMAPTQELADAIAKVEDLARDGSLDAFVTENDAARAEIGQFTVLVVRKIA
jgi:ubiquinone/menaquinone biosynthesis C-methylase UbiE